MATKKNKAEEVTEEVTSVQESAPTFTKKQIINSRLFGRYRDYLNANLEDNKSYTKAEVAEVIEKAFKVKIKI